MERAGQRSGGSSQALKTTAARAWRSLQRGPRLGLSKHPHVAGAHHESLLPELRWGINKTWPEDGRDHSARKLWAGSGESTSSQAIRKILSSDSSTCRKGLHRNIRSVSHSLAAHASAPHRCVCECSVPVRGTLSNNAVGTKPPLPAARCGSANPNLDRGRIC